ncbi:MAG: glycosyltransferase family 2 protein, partial [Christensenellaceae bacterium]
MKYSILIPVYNTEQYLARAVESVEGQGVDDYEIVIVDDGSTDQSGEIARSLAQRNDRIKLIRQENAYVGAARNRAVAEARGDYLYFLDSDDVLLEGVLSRLMPRGEDVIASAIRFDTGETLESVSGEELFLFSPYLGQSFYKRELVQSAPAFSTERKTAEDCEWLFALLQRAQSFGLRAYPFYRYTVGRDGSLCNAYRADRLAPTIRTWL